MPEQPMRPEHDVGNDQDWSLSSQPTPLHSGQGDDEASFASPPPTYTFQSLPNLPAQTRWGTMNLGSRLLLRFEIPGLVEPIRVEMFDTLLLGRACQLDNQLSVDLNPYGGYWHGVSRHHALILVDDDVLKLVDLQSTNGTFLNGCLLPPHQPRILRDGDEIALSRLIITIHFG